MTLTTIPSSPLLATASSPGAMSAADKVKLDAAISVTLAQGELVANLDGTVAPATLNALASVTGLTIGGAQFALTPTAGTLTIDWNTGNNQTPSRLSSGNNTVTLSNPKDGAVYSIRFLQPTSGAAGTLTLPSGTDGVTINSGALSPVNSAVNFLVLRYCYDLRQYYGVIS